MTRDQIEEMFIKAAEIEAKLPAVKGLKEQWGRYSLAWVHDMGDINMRRREIGDKLLPGDDPLGEWSKVSKVLGEWERKAKTVQVANWEACIEIGIGFVSDPKARRALWAWAMSKAGTLRPRSFARWCRKVENIHEETGRRRKNAAIDAILQALCGKADLRGEIRQNSVLPCGAETGHVPATVPGVHEAKPTPTWRDDPAFLPIEFHDARRRKLAERRRRAEAKEAA